MTILINEKVAIMKALDYIHEQSNRLMDERTKLLDRLRELDEIENLASKDKVPQPAGVMTVTQAIQKHNETFHAEPAPTKEYSYDSEKERVKTQDYKNKPVKDNGRRDIKAVAEVVRKILRGKGIPVKTGQLLRLMRAEGIKTNSPYALLNQVATYDPKIQKASFGYYQYRG